MKHKLTVLACLGLALLLSTGFAFAQNSITVESKSVNRCSNVSVAVSLNNADQVDAIGLPLVISGGGSFVSAAPAARLASHTTAVNLVGNNILLNAVGSCLAAGNGAIWNLTIATPSVCSGSITIDTAFFAPVPVASLLITGCDCCELPVSFTAGTLTLQNNAPTCGVNSNENLDFSGQIVDKQLNATDPDACDALTFAKVSGPGTVSADGKFNWDPACADVGVHTVIFSATDPCGAAVNCQFDVTVTQNAPVCQGIAAQSVHWADNLSVALPATDDGCPNPLTWSIVSVVPPVAGPLSVAGGTLNYDPTCSDIGVHTLTYAVSDGAKADTCSVDITVTNTAPTVQCPAPDDQGVLCHHQLIDDDGIFNVGDLIAGDAIGNDADGDGLTYSIISSTGPGPLTNAPSIDASGHFSWQSDGLDQIGVYEFCIEVSDGCATDQCCFDVTLESKFYVKIGDSTGTVDTIPTLVGTTGCVYLSINPNIPLGGFDLLLSYDQSALSFQSIMTLNDLNDWEYWTYRMSANSNCTGGCPSGLLRIVAIADLDNGPTNHPPASSFGLEGNVLKICFLVTNDINFVGLCLPIDFITIDCGDNTLSSMDGNTTYMAFGSDPACLEGVPGKGQPDEHIQFCGGWICPRPPADGRGDLNLDGISNSVADAVLYSNYFIYGSSVWDATYEANQVRASDVNNDGITLTVADLVYLIRIITGDAQPFPDDENVGPKVAPYAGAADAITTVADGQITVTTNSSVDLGGALLTFRYSGVSVGDAQLTDAASQMAVKSAADRGEMKVLMVPQMNISGARIPAGINNIVTIPYTGNGTVELVDVQLSDANGAMLTSNLAKIEPPKSYSLLQNYPNPFNAGTVIRFDLKDASDWSLTVYNITGQVVRTFTGHNDASTVSVTWDGRDNSNHETASGVYFYRVNAGNFTATKKMTLLK